MCIICIRKDFCLKRRNLIKLLKQNGFYLDRHGGNHDIYRRGSNIEKIPRHKEVNETLARMIIKKWNL